MQSMDDVHADGASPSENKGAIASKGAEVEGKEEEGADPFATALERLTKSGKKAKLIAEKANSGVMELQKTMMTMAERLERMENAGVGKADEDDTVDEFIAEDGTKFKKSDVENLKKVAKAAGLSGGSERRMERIERLLEDNEIDKRLDADEVSASEKKLVREVLKSRIQRTDDLDEDLRMARAIAHSLVQEHTDDADLRHATSVAGASAAGVSGRRSSRPRLSSTDQDVLSALKEAFPDKKWEEKFLATKQ